MLPVTFAELARCDGFARYGTHADADRAWRGNPARGLMVAASCAQCGQVHVRRQDVVR